MVPVLDTRRDGFESSADSGGGTEFEGSAELDEIDVTARLAALKRAMKEKEKS